MDELEPIRLRCGKCKKWLKDDCPYLDRGQEKDDTMYWCYEKDGAE